MDKSPAALKETSFPLSPEYSRNTQSSTFDGRASRTFHELQSHPTHSSMDHQKYFSSSVDNGSASSMSVDSHVLSRPLSGMEMSSSMGYLPQAPFNMMEMNYRYGYLGMPSHNKPIHSGFSMYGHTDPVHPVRSPLENTLSSASLTPVNSVQAECTVSSLPEDVMLSQCANSSVKVSDLNSEKRFGPFKRTAVGNEVSTVKNDELIIPQIESQKHVLHDPPHEVLESDNSVAENLSVKCTMESSSTTVGNCNEIPAIVENDIYTCGGCCETFETACKLHFHLLGHEEGGSYKYNHHLRTAFPTFDTVCNGTQTVKQESKQKDTQVHEVIDEGKSYKQVQETCSRNEKSIDTANVHEEDTKDEPTTQDTGNHYLNLRNKKHRRSKFIKVNLEDNTVEIVSKSCLPLDITNGITNNDSNEFQGVKVEEEDESGDDMEKISDTEQDKPNSYERETEDLRRKRKFNLRKRGKTQVKQILSKYKSAAKKSQSNKQENTRRRQNKHVSGKIERTHACDICEKMYATKMSLAQHKKNIHQEKVVSKPQECKWCGEIFEKRQFLSAHIRQCDKNETLKCFICDTFQSSKEVLTEHLASHRNEADLTCNLCMRELPNEILMQSHSKRHKLPKNIQCDQCGKAFYYQNMLSKHLMYCNNERRFECLQCEQKFKSKEALKHHSSVHNEDRPYVCHICGYAGKKLMYLKRHIRSHTGERPYPCKLCGMRFSALNGLNRHKKVHTNSKNCICTYCGKSFANNWNLKTHERQHTGDTPYKCEHCGMGFKQNVLVKLHIKSHHPYL